MVNDYMQAEQEQRRRDDVQQQIGAAVREERRRLARDLHDSVTQALYGVTLHAEAATRLLAAGDVSTTTQYLHVLQHTAQEALDELRLLIFDLRPPVLDQVGLVAALQARLNAVAECADLQTQLVVDIRLKPLPSVVEDVLYRIAQEALNNVLKHSAAQHVTLRLYSTATGVGLEVTDDGRGFDPAPCEGQTGVGLRGMAERAAQLGGQLRVQRGMGGGTQLRMEIAV